jgi:hypothetical protein
MIPELVMRELVARSAGGPVWPGQRTWRGCTAAMTAHVTGDVPAHDQTADEPAGYIPARRWQPPSTPTWSCSCSRSPDP